MVVFGLVLLVLALAVIAYMWFATRGVESAQISYGFLNIDVTPFWMFLAGGITLAVATCGLWLMAVGARSRARRSKEVRQLRRQAQESGRTGSGTTTGTGAGHDRATDARGGATDRNTAAGTTGSGQDRPILPRQSSTGHGTGTVTSTTDQQRSNSLDVDR